ncbi:MAG: DUF438 domain-containing protein [Chloroflexi bacterium]|nr:DUF438 domain-containing protein [Chloroflexota bacterium]
MSEHINNQTERKEALKQVIRQLHEGKTVEEVKGEFAALLQGVSAMDIAQIEQELIQEGMPPVEVKRLCDVHVAVFRESLETQDNPDTVPGHPVYTFLAENGAAGRVLDTLQEAIDASQWERARERLRELRKYEVHYVRKENILFPFLEKHGFTGPSSVMWAIHDDVRAGWKALDAMLTDAPGDDAESFAAQMAEIFEPLATAIREMFYKEENILYPTALQKLSGEEWLQIRQQSPETGYCYVQPGNQWPPKETALESTSALLGAVAKKSPIASGGMLHLDTGTLTPQEVNRLLTNLPVDVTYVDADDTVRYFSQGRERIFPRSPAIIGRKVQKCHPPASFDRVQQILDDFRAGQRDEAEFWIQMGPKFIHIRYFAVRDEQGEYQGTLEVSQDIAPIRALEGERRLLDEKE